ncbi:MAG: ribosome recycling factor [Patescibacteria group bacterium]
MGDLREKMEKVLEMFRKDLSALQVGRANASLVEDILVEAYETKMPIIELATIITPESSQLLITPFDRTIIRNIEKALSSDKVLKASCSVEEDAIRLKFPPLTEEKRKELVKVLGQKMESARMMIRQARQDKMQEVKRSFEEKEVSEDDKFRKEKEIQDVTDEFNQAIAKIGQEKEAQLLRV